MSGPSQLLQRLCDAEIDFVIVGGFAGTLHGSSLLTRDLDVCAVLTAETVAKLREALRDTHPLHRLTSPKRSFLDHSDLDGTFNNLYLQTELGPIDLLTAIKGVGDYARVRAASVEMELFGRRYRVISIQDLITAKEALGREKDLLAAKELRVICENQG